MAKLKSGTRIYGNASVDGNLIVGAGVSAVGIVTATSFSGDGSALTGIAVTANVRTNSLVVSGMTTATGGIQVGATTSIVVGSSFIQNNAIGIEIGRAHV